MADKEASLPDNDPLKGFEKFEDGGHIEAEPSFSCTCGNSGEIILKVNAEVKELIKSVFQKYFEAHLKAK